MILPPIEPKVNASGRCSQCDTPVRVHGPEELHPAPAFTWMCGCHLKWLFAQPKGRVPMERAAWCHHCGTPMDDSTPVISKDQLAELRERWDGYWEHCERCQSAEVWKQRPELEWGAK